MKQARLHGPRALQVDEVPYPTMGENDVLVDVVACGICGSDLGFYEHGSIRSDGAPMPLGHEFSGVIRAVGAAVEHYAPGMRVVVNPMANGAMIGVGSNDGALAPTVCVRNVDRGPILHEIPAHVPTDVAALVEPLAVALHAVNRSRAAPGESALVLGAGAIGLGIVACLSARGVSQIVVADLSAKRLEIAAKLGASVIINPAQEDLWLVLAQAHGTVPTFLAQSAPATRLIFESSGASAVLHDAIAHARDGARITVASVYKQPQSFDFSILQVKELELIGTMCYPTEFGEALDLLGSDAFEAAAMISHRFVLDDVEHAYQAAADPHISAKVIITP
ncbi:zinc-dependent alcohol dehydrogenase [Metapseudomonas boanensis]|uniref:Alcohol dehydrogenase catalytic domain-containing protein n=1 Tax=Metapseudomonas boanensis TaxID=2822138 RepID=A0ABS5XBH8_9GAMM|nr:alcohol dehydrogenase catalytic domain-containing protein [Pseudomonas boanensis]